LGLPKNLPYVPAFLASSEGGHTLRSHDLEMILAGGGNGVSDGEHREDVRKLNE